MAKNRSGPLIKDWKPIAVLVCIGLVPCHSVSRRARKNRQRLDSARQPACPELRAEVDKRVQALPTYAKMNEYEKEDCDQTPAR